MTAINELKRIKIGFQAMEVGGTPEQREYPNFEYHTVRARKFYFTFVLEAVGEAQQWVLIDTNLRGNFNAPDLHGFKAGPAFQAEMGLRLVDGKRLCAEDYLDSLDRLPVVDVGHWPDPLLEAHLVINKADEARMMDERYYGYTYDAETCSMVQDGDVLRIAVPLVNLNNLLLVESAPWHAEGKTVSLSRSPMLNDPIPAVSPVPVGGETLELFQAL